MYRKTVFPLALVFYLYGISATSSEDPGEPLLLSPFLKQNRIAEGRAAARVFLGGRAQNVTSYAGYFTLNQVDHGNMYFWFFPSEHDYKNDPVILWIQGQGPGLSSLYGLFMQNGPFMVNRNGELELREHRWTKNHSVIYVDNPLGAGFSFSDHGTLASTQWEVANQLYGTLQQFFKLFPEFQKNEFFIAGESYGGKYVTGLGYILAKTQKLINIQGVAIGNGYIDQEHQSGYGRHLYQLGLIDSDAMRTVDMYEKQYVYFISQNKGNQSMDVWEQMWTFILNKTGNVNVYNYLRVGKERDSDPAVEFLNRSSVRRAIHVGNVTFEGVNVPEYLREDLTRPITIWFLEVIKRCRVLLYSGQLDLTMPYPLTEQFLNGLEFEYAQEYRHAVRKIWHVAEEIAGYSKTVSNFTEVLVRNAGNMVSHDQPKWALDMISKFVRNQPLE